MIGKALRRRISTEEDTPLLAVVSQQDIVGVQLLNLKML